MLFSLLGQYDAFRSGGSIKCFRYEGQYEMFSLWGQYKAFSSTAIACTERLEYLW